MLLTKQWNNEKCYDKYIFILLDYWIIWDINLYSLDILNYYFNYFKPYICVLISNYYWQIKWSPACATQSDSSWHFAPLNEFIA